MGGGWDIESLGPWSWPKDWGRQQFEQQIVTIRKRENRNSSECISEGLISLMNIDDEASGYNMIISFGRWEGKDIQSLASDQETIHEHFLRPNLGRSPALDP